MSASFFRLQLRVSLTARRHQTACHSNSSEIGLRGRGGREGGRNGAKDEAQPPTACQLLHREVQRCHAASIPNGHFLYFSLECFLKQSGTWMVSSAIQSHDGRTTITGRYVKICANLQPQIQVAPC
jgi:hypothetical protein